MPGDDADCTEVELPPAYQCTVTMASLVLFKWELDSPLCCGKRRRWQRARVRLVGTQLRLCIAGTDITLSMQGADIGIATDYYRRSFVLRTRAEGRQFLIAAGTQSAMVDLLVKLNESIAISLPLDTREDPTQYTLPRKRPPKTMKSLSDQLWRYWREHWWRRTQDMGWLDQGQSCRVLRIAEKRLPTVASWNKPESAEKYLDDNATMSTSWPEDDRETPEISSLSAEDLKHAQECARVLWYNSTWRDRWHFKDGFAVPNPRGRERSSDNACLAASPSQTVFLSAQWFPMM
ncbi:hypothetical protein ANO11243_018360 [Dothideomycetidae sp. 11243]|nr:hypothetical protein ANO11243_018360 [fungal sp. No.11243]